MSADAQAPDSVRVIINSANRVVPADPTYNFTYTLDKPVRRVSSIEVASIQIPFTFYAVNSTNNQFTTSDGTATLTNGNYNSVTFPAMIKSALDALGPAHTVSYSTATQKITISQGGNFVIFVGGANDAAGLLGFTATTADLNSHTGDAVSIFTGPFYIVIKSAALSKYNGSPPATSSGLASNTIIHTVPVNVNPGSVIFDAPPSNTSLIPLNALDSFEELLDFQLEDDQGNPLDLNGGNWSMQLVMRAN